MVADSLPSASGSNTSGSEASTLRLAGGFGGGVVAAGDADANVGGDVEDVPAVVVEGESVFVEGCVEKDLRLGGEGDGEDGCGGGVRGYEQRLGAAGVTGVEEDGAFLGGIAVIGDVDHNTGGFAGEGEGGLLPRTPQPQSP